MMSQNSRSHPIHDLPQGGSHASLTSAQARQKILSTVAAAMLDACSFSEDTTVVMDYACASVSPSYTPFCESFYYEQLFTFPGSDIGSLSQRLAPFSKSILGVDINPDTVQEYNVKVANQGISPEEMRAICVELRDEPQDIPVGYFDVVVCSQAYHHFPSIDETTLLLTKFLKPHGMLLVSDLIKGTYARQFHRPRSPSQHAYNNVVHRGGLTEPQIRAAFGRAGLTDIHFEIITTINREGREIDVFLAQGVRPTKEI